MPLTQYELVRERFAADGISPDDFDALYAQFRASGFNNFSDWLRVETSRLEPTSFWRRFGGRAAEAYTGRSLKGFVLFHLQMGGLTMAAGAALVVGVIAWGAISDALEPEPAPSYVADVPVADAAAAPAALSAATSAPDASVVESQATDPSPAPISKQTGQGRARAKPAETDLVAEATACITQAAKTAQNCVPSTREEAEALYAAKHQLGLLD